VSRIDNPHNCHSGLGKYPELSHGKLVRFLPKTIEDVKAVVEEVVSAQPIGFIKQDEGEETWH
jgi:hypothetical protein